MYMECGVEFAKSDQRSAASLAGLQGRILVVHDRPIGVALDQNIILQFRVETGIERGLLPECPAFLIKIR
jgi:hypothetical protein